MLPDNEKNIVGYSSFRYSVATSPDWELAKRHFNFASAERVINQLWTAKKTEALKKKFSKPSEVVLITVPSTSRKNAVPIQLAKRLSKSFQSQYIVGDNYFKSLHFQESKNISRLNRVFNPRKYKQRYNINVFKKLVKNKKVVIVEDVLTTGGSVSKFIKALKEQDIKVESVVGLMGEKRLKVDERTKKRLNKALKNLGISISEDKIKSIGLTRTEAGGLITLLNTRRSENAKQKLTGKLQGLFGEKIIKDLGRDTITTRNQSFTENDRTDGRSNIRLQTRPVFSNTGTEGIIKDFEEAVKRYEKKLKEFLRRKEFERVQKEHLKNLFQSVRLLLAGFFLALVFYVSLKPLKFSFYL
jgi:hypoxanthine phosphoribosyltransferase